MDRSPEQNQQNGKGVWLVGGQLRLLIVYDAIHGLFLLLAYSLRSYHFFYLRPCLPITPAVPGTVEF